MPMIETQRWCDECGRNVLAHKRGCNHLAHAVITLFLLGLWIPVWVIAGLNTYTVPYRCSRCGGKV